MLGRLILVGATVLSSALAVPAPAPAPQQQFNTASVNTTGNTPSSTVEATQASATPSSYGGAKANLYKTPAFLPHGESLLAKLEQAITNGNSVLGTSKAPKLPPFLKGGPLPQGFPWGGKTASNTNPYTSPPNTGVTQYYDFTVSKKTLAPDGVDREMLVINGAFPGPTIEANWGDWIQVTVHNALDDEGTAMHWHGLLQTATPWLDGVPAVQMCPIAPGGSFTYRFKADLYGTSWYHSHYSAQYAAGLAGAMIIHGPKSAAYDVDLGPVFINDWYHDDYYTLVEQTMAPASANELPPISNNNLINGKMNYPCESAPSLQCTPNAGVSKFNFQSGKKHLLRLINGGAEGIQKFSIDGYTLTVVANDFVPIKPYTTDVVTLAVGQRADIIVTASGKPTDAVWMRSTLGLSAFVGGCTLNDGVSPEAVAAIYYEKANTTAVPTTVSTVSADKIGACVNDDLSLTTPFYTITPPSKPAASQNIDITYQSNGTHNLFYMNNSTFRADYNDPVLLDAKLGKTVFPAEHNVYNFGSSKSIRLVVYNWATTGAHPMHMHGHNMYILNSGTGTWDGSVVNAKNPQRRDVQLLPNAVTNADGTVAAPGYIVIQIDSDNPGVWPFHCHIAWHVSAGLYINILERPADIKKSMNIPSTMAQTCRDWSSWTGNNVVPEIDSGL